MGKSIDDKWLEKFYAEVGRELSLARESQRETHNWVITVTAGALTAFVALGNGRFLYPTESLFVGVLMLIPLLFRFFVRSCLEYQIFHRWTTIRTALDAYFKESDTEKKKSSAGYLEEVIELYYFRFKAARSVSKMIRDNIKLAYGWPFLVLLTLLIWGLSVQQFTPVVMGGLALFFPWMAYEVVSFVHYRGFEYEPTEIRPNHVRESPEETTDTQTLLMILVGVGATIVLLTLFGFVQAVRTSSFILHWSPPTSSFLLIISIVLFLGGVALLFLGGKFKIIGTLVSLGGLTLGLGGLEISFQQPTQPQPTTGGGNERAIWELTYTVTPFPDAIDTISDSSVLHGFDRYLERLRPRLESDTLSTLLLVGRADKRNLRPLPSKFFGSNDNLANRRALFVMRRILTRFPGLARQCITISSGARNVGINVLADSLAADRCVELYACWNRSMSSIK